jgi:hypothetical protein
VSTLRPMLRTSVESKPSKTPCAGRISSRNKKSGGQIWETSERIRRGIGQPALPSIRMSTTAAWWGAAALRSPGQSRRSLLSRYFRPATGGCKKLIHNKMERVGQIVYHKSFLCFDIQRLDTRFAERWRWYQGWHIRFIPAFNILLISQTGRENFKIAKIPVNVFEKIENSNNVISPLEH